MPNAYPPCHCLLDSAGYLGLVELLVRRRCQIARRLPGQPGHPDELHKSLVSRPNSTRRVLNAHPRDTNGRESPAVRFFVARRSVADPYPSPYGWPNLGPRGTIPPTSLIHESAYQPGGDYARHLPPMRSQQAEQGFRRFPPSAGRVMQCERSHSITVALRVIIGPKIGSFGHWQLSAGETCSP